MQTVRTPNCSKEGAIPGQYTHAPPAFTHVTIQDTGGSHIKRTALTNWHTPSHSFLPTLQHMNTHTLPVPYCPMYTHGPLSLFLPHQYWTRPCKAWPHHPPTQHTRPLNTPTHSTHPHVRQPAQPAATNSGIWKVVRRPDLGIVCLVGL